MSHAVPSETLVKQIDDTAHRRFITSAMETQRNFQLWLTMLTLLILSRVVHVFALKSYWPAESRMEDFAAAFMRGFRFDCQASTLLISLPLLVGSLVVFSTRLVSVSRFVRTMTAAVFILPHPSFSLVELATTRHMTTVSMRLYLNLCGETLGAHFRSCKLKTAHYKSCFLHWESLACCGYPYGD